MRRPLNQFGDTIVEVLIALAVVSSVLGGAYTVANRSLNNGRQAQERGEALKYVEEQVERLKSLSAAGSPIFIGESLFCINDSNTKVAIDNPDCQKGSGVTYNLSVERTDSNTFAAWARWDRAGGGGREELRLLTRLYP